MYPSNFTSLIGQHHTKRRLEFYVDSYADTGVFPSLLLKASKGMGKTTLARLIASQLCNACRTQFKADKYIVEVNCASIKSADDWITKFLATLARGLHITYFFDEIHALPSAVSDWLLTALDPDRVTKTVTYGSHTAVVDFRKVSIIAATTEPQKVFTALANRFQSVELVDYSLDELAMIIHCRAATPAVPSSVTLEVARYLATVSRGNARSAADISREVVRYLAVNHKEEFTIKDAERLMGILDVFPLGLSRAEFNMLKTISEYPNISLTALCAMTGLTRAAQQDSEHYLMKHGLMDIDKASKRVVTEDGRGYLAAQGVATSSAVTRSNLLDMSLP